MIEEGYNEKIENEKFIRKLDQIENQLDEFEDNF